MDVQLDQFVLPVDRGKSMIFQVIQPTGCIDQLSQALEMHFPCFVICIYLLPTP